MSNGIKRTTNPSQSFAKASAQPKNDIKTKAELNQREANRPKPRVDLEFTPNGTVRKFANRQVNIEHNNRIQQLKAGLANADGKFKRNITRDLATGKAKAAFGKSR